MRGKAPALIAQGLGGEAWLAPAKAARFSHRATVAPALTAVTRTAPEPVPA